MLVSRADAAASTPSVLTSAQATAPIASSGGGAFWSRRKG